MRPIKFFVITQTKLEYPGVVEDSFTKGMMYPAPHFYIFKMDDNDENEEYKVVKMRPINERCGIVRDSSLNATGVGIVAFNPSGDVFSGELKQVIATLIKGISDDFGIIQYQIVSDEVNEDNFVNTTELPALVSITPSIFNKRI